MKKFFTILFSIILTVVFLVCLSSCGKNSGLDISTFTATMKDTDDYLNLKETNGEFCYTYENVSYTVTCDKKEYITSIFIESKDIPSNYLNSPSKIEETLHKNFMQWNTYDYRVAKLFARYSSILKLFNEDFSSLTVNDITEMISWERKNNYGNWEVYIEIESNQANIIANYLS